MNTRKLAAVLAAGAALAAALPAPAAAQTGDTIYACYIPNTGNVYRIKTADTREECANTNHVQFDWLRRLNLSSQGGALLLRLRSGSPLGDRFVVDSAGGFVAVGHLGIGVIPREGGGERTMWFPFKGAFRSGGVQQDRWNDANIGFYSWAGGYDTQASGIYSLAFGNNNVAGAQAAVALGSGNDVAGGNPGFGTAGFAAGLNNRVSDIAGVAIGHTNNSAGDAAVAIGFRTTADADYSMAFGYRASTNGHTGAKVFGDASTTDSIEAVANNEFAVRAAGGFRFRTNATMTTGCNLAAGSGVFSCSSSKYLKENFADVDGEDVLARVRSVPVTTWSYIAEGGQVRHMGPFAQDFRAAFGLGTDDTSIGLLDIDGVNFAAIKALEARTAEVATLKTQVERLQADRDDLSRRLAELEAIVKAQK